VEPCIVAVTPPALALTSLLEPADAVATGGRVVEVRVEAVLVADLDARVEALLEELPQLAAARAATATTRRRQWAAFRLLAS